MKTPKPYCRACLYEYSSPEEEKRGACFCRDYPENHSYEPSVNRAGGGIGRAGDGTPTTDYDRSAK